MLNKIIYLVGYKIVTLPSALCIYLFYFKGLVYVFSVFIFILNFD